MGKGPLSHPFPAATPTLRKVREGWATQGVADVGERAKNAATGRKPPPLAEVRHFRQIWPSRLLTARRYELKTHELHYAAFASFGMAVAHPFDRDIPRNAGLYS